MELSRKDIRNSTIGILCGGLSAEREVSLRTGAAVEKALLGAGYRAVKIDAGRELANQLREAGVEIAFLSLHGRYGEDGTVQGVLELMGIPYTGSGVLASALAMDKVATKKILLHHELPTPGFACFGRGEDRDGFLDCCRHFPLVVKPAREGSTIGISIAHDRQELKAGLDEALQCDSLVLVEDYIDGLEVTVSVLGEEALPIIQIVPKGGFYDYQAKYTAGQTEYLLPAPLPAVLYERLQQVAVQACKVIGCRGAARVDFMVREREFYCLEVNTIPGMTETSLLPKAAAEAGMNFTELVKCMLFDAGLNR